MFVGEVLTCDARTLSVNMLDDLPDEVSDGERLTVIKPTEAGLAHWGARLESVRGNTAAVTVDGAVDIVQRRAHPRVTALLPVSCRRSAEPGQRCSGRTVNLSAGGARVNLDARLEVGDRVDLNFDNGANHIEIHGRVVMAIPDGGESRWSVSVAFDSPRPQAAAELARLLDGLASA
jgi:hypothetical protein